MSDYLTVTPQNWWELLLGYPYPYFLQGRSLESMLSTRRFLCLPLCGCFWRECRCSRQCDDMHIPFKWYTEFFICSQEIIWFKNFVTQVKYKICFLFSISKEWIPTAIVPGCVSFIINWYGFYDFIFGLSKIFLVSLNPQKIFRAWARSMLNVKIHDYYRWN